MVRVTTYTRATLWELLCKRRERANGGTEIYRYTIQRKAGNDVAQAHHVLQTTRLNAFCSPLHQCHCGAEALHWMDEIASVRVHECKKSTHLRRSQ